MKMGDVAKLRIVVLTFIALALFISLTSCDYFTFEKNSAGDATTLVVGKDNSENSNNKDLPIVDSHPILSKEELDSYINLVKYDKTKFNKNHILSSNDVQDTLEEIIFQQKKNLDLNQESDLPCISSSTLFKDTSTLNKISDDLKKSKNICFDEITALKPKAKTMLKDRKEKLKELIKTNPQKAFEVEPVPVEIRSVLSEKEKKELIESKSKKSGVVEKLIAHTDEFYDDMSDESETSEIITMLHTDDETFQVYGEFPDLPTGSEVDFEGISVDDAIAFDLADGNENIVVASVPENADVMDNFGVQNTLVLIGTFIEGSYPNTIELAEQKVFGETNSLKEYYKVNSYDQIDFQGEVHGYYYIDEQEADSLDKFRRLMLQAALDDGIDVASFKRIILAHQQTSWSTSWAGIATIGTMHDYELPNGQITDLSFASVEVSMYSLRVLTHEVGHNMGMNHAMRIKCYDGTIYGGLPISDLCLNDGNYKDYMDVMGGSTTGLFSATHKHEAGWLSDNHVQTVTEDGLYTIYPVDIQLDNDEIQLLRIPIRTEFTLLGSHPDNAIMIDFRDDTGYNNPWQGQGIVENELEDDGIHVRYARMSTDGEFTGKQTAIVINEPNLGEIVSGESIYPIHRHAFKEGETFTDEYNGVTVTVEEVTPDYTTVSVTTFPTYDVQDPILNFNFDTNLYSTGSFQPGFIYLTPRFYDGGTRTNGAIHFDGIGTFDARSIGRYASGILMKENEFSLSFTMTPESETIDYQENILSVGPIGVFQKNDIFEVWVSFKTGNMYSYVKLNAPRLFINDETHVFISYDGNMVYLYLDDILVDSSNILYNSYSEEVGVLSDVNWLYSYFGELIVGGDGVYAYTGSVDNIILYARTLSDEERNNLYENDAIVLLPNYPTSGSFVPSDFSISLFLGSEKDISYCSLYVDDVLTDTINNPLNGLISFSSLQLEENAYTWYVVCEDVNGFIKQTSPSTFSLDLLDPTYSGFNVPPSVDYGSYVSISSYWYDSNPEKVSLYVNGEYAYERDWTEDGQWLLFWWGDASGAESFTIKAVGEDKAGNIVETNEFTVAVTNIPEAEPTCDDGIMNGEEEDVDCGGSCPACDLCVDEDGDGFGVNCDNGLDCDDSNELINPSALEICNSFDDDCDTEVDEENVCGVREAGIYYVSTNGNNASDGLTPQTAWRTIQYAADNVQAGDTVHVLPGTYYEQVKTNRHVSGTSDSPIVFEGEEGTIINGGLFYDGEWILAPEVGDGVYKISHNGEPPEVMHVDGKKIPGFVYNLTENIPKSYWINDDPINDLTLHTGYEMISQPSDKMLYLDDDWVTHNLQINYWDGVDALWGYDDEYTYIHFRNNDYPNNYEITYAPIYSGTFNIWWSDYIIVRNFDMLSANYGVYLRYGASNNIIENNDIYGGSDRIYITGHTNDTRSSNNTVRNNNIYPRFLSDKEPGAWTLTWNGDLTSDELQDIAMKFAYYIRYKYWFGYSGTYDTGLALHYAGDNNKIYNNNFDSDLVGMRVQGSINRPMVNSEIYNNTFSHASSVGIAIVYGNSETKFYDNFISDANTPIRLHHIDEIGDINRSAYIFRNIVSQPYDISDMIFTHHNNQTNWPEGQEHPHFYIYHNTFTGGKYGITGMSEPEQEGLPNSLIINNIFSSPRPLYWSSTVYNSPLVSIGGYDYNWISGPLSSYLDPDRPWLGANNVIIDDEFIWDEYPADYNLPDDSSAIDAGIDVSKSFTINGVTYDALPGFEEGYFNGNAPDIGAIESDFIEFVPQNICEDMVDNDGDGLVDTFDPGCYDGDLNSETLSSYEGYSIDELETLFNIYLQSEFLLNNNNVGNISEPASTPYNLAPFIPSLIQMYEVTQNKTYIEYALIKIELTLANMTDIDGDGYLEWIKKSGSTSFDHDNNNLTVNRTSCLYTLRGMRTAPKVVRIIKQNSELNSLYGERADNVSDLIQHNIINDPHCAPQYFHRVHSTVHHLVSHATQILLDTYLTYGNLSFENESVTRGYYDVLSLHADALKTSLFDNPDDTNAYIWSGVISPFINQTYPECYNVSALCYRGSGEYTSPLDVSHSQDFIYTMIDLYRSDLSFNQTDVNRFIYTFENFILNNTVTDPVYNDFIDGMIELPLSEGGRYGSYVMGSNIAPGWTLLGGFNNELQMIFENGDVSEATNTRLLNEMAFYSSLAKNKLVSDCQYSNGAIEVCDDIDNDCDGHIDENLDCSVEEDPEEESSGGNNGGGGGAGGSPPPLPPDEPTPDADNESDNSSNNNQNNNAGSNDNGGNNNANNGNEIPPDVESPSTVINNTGNTSVTTTGDESDNKFFGNIAKGVTSTFSRVFASSSSGGFIVVIILGVLLVFGIGGVVAYRHFSHPTYDIALSQSSSSMNEENIDSSSQTQTINSDTGSNSYIISFDDFLRTNSDASKYSILNYLNTVFESGLSEDKVSILLINSGWTQSAIESSFSDYKSLKSEFNIYKFLTSCKIKGLTKDDAKNMLINNGWNENQVTDKISKYWTD